MLSKWEKVSGAIMDGLHPWHPRPRDRKSTRLNSSHQIISYAVFCLKKKNKILKYRPHLTSYPPGFMSRTNRGRTDSTSYIPHVLLARTACEIYRTWLSCVS